MLKNFMMKAMQATADLKAGALKFKNRNFLNACVAGAYMVASSDGSVSDDEKKKLLSFIKADDALSVYDPTEVITAFNDIEKIYDFDKDAGDAKALKSISNIAKSSAEAKFLVRMIVAIASSDNNIDESEKKAISKICAELSLSASDFF